ncbi:MAG: DUF4145 domain-containing protein [Terracidiphilus sp.]|jgi:hypothetical protein
MKTRDYSFLHERVRQALEKLKFWPKGDKTPVSAYVIQLVDPDYWIILSCHTPESQTQLLFRGKWSQAADYFSELPSSFPNPEIKPFPFAPKSRPLFEIAREVFRSRLINLPETLLGGSSGWSFFADGVTVFDNPGILRNSRRLYFEGFFENKTQPTKRAAINPFQLSNHDRKAFYCRFPMIKSTESPGSEFKAEIYRALGSDQFSLTPSVKRPFVCGSVQLILFGNGFLVADERHQIKAMEAMNSFLAYCFFRQVGCAPANAQDIGSIDIKADGSSHSWTPYQSAIPRTKWVDTTIPAAKADLLLQEFSADFDKELTLELRLLHLSCFHFIAGELLQSFSLAWTVLERKIAKMWRDQISSKGYAGVRLDQLCDSERYTMSVKIDMLEFTGPIEQGQATKLNSIRRARNKASHEGRIPSKEETEDCLHLASEFIKASWEAMSFDCRKLTQQ